MMPQIDDWVQHLTNGVYAWCNIMHGKMEVDMVKKVPWLPGEPKFPKSASS